MIKHQYHLSLAMALISLTSLGFAAQSAKAVDLNTQGGKGAKVYCYMRSNGNHHEVSWNASYALLKRQSNSMFKTSPKHAAVMITEAVVQEPDSFPNCGRYLGDLFGANKETESNDSLTTMTTEASAENMENVEDRYTY